jgi:hypothetical protein
MERMTKKQFQKRIEVDSKAGLQVGLAKRDGLIKICQVVDHDVLGNYRRQMKYCTLCLIMVGTPLMYLDQCGDNLEIE